MRTTPLLLVALVAAGDLHAQSNTVPGLDGALTLISSATYYGRRGSAHPNGEIGMAFLNRMCNPGSVTIPWFRANPGPSPMGTNHPKFAFMVARESDGRMVQINDWRSYCKHAFTSVNSGSTCGGTCQNPGTGTVMGINCSDTYGAGNNADRYWLGPPEEIDPWLGIWNPIGSYFDRGDPAVGSPQNSDGVRSLNSGSFSDSVKNRVTMREQDLLASGRFFYAIHLVHEGEDGDRRANNLAHRQMVPNWNGSTWSFASSGVGFTLGSVLNQWQGASLDQARNGDDDGHLIVAVKVSGPTAGLYHYEYAAHNFDNNRGAATLRIPVCPGSTVSNVGFRDVDDNTLNEWTWSRVGDELMFQASANNPLNWNMLFNFWFDCSEGPVAGQIELDQARIGPGNLSVAVNSQIPGGTARVLNIGPGCGSPSPVISAVGLPTIPNAGFALSINGSPNAGLFVFYSLGSANVPLGNGCVQYLDQTTLGTHGFLMANGSGVVTVSLPIPDNLALEGLPLTWQAAQIVNGGPLFGQFTISNGFQTRLGCR